MTGVDDFEQWRLKAQQPSATAPDDDFDQWRLQARQKQQAPTPSPAPNKSPVEAPKPSRGLMERLFSKPTEEETAQADARRKATQWAARGSSPTGKDVKAQSAAREAAFNKEVEEGKVVPFEKLYQDDTRFKTMNDAMKVFGKEWDGKQPKEEFAKDFMKHMRSVEQNTLAFIGNKAQFSNANKAKRAAMADAEALFQSVPGFWQRGAEPGLGKLGQTVGNVVLDPVNYIGPGAGVVAKGGVKLLQAGNTARKVLNPVVVAGATDATISGAVNLDQQRLRHEQSKYRTIEGETPEENKERQEKKFEANKVELAVVSLLSGALSAAGTKGLTDAAASSTSPSKLGTRLAAATKKAEDEAKAKGLMPPADAAKVVISDVDKQMDEEVKKYVQQMGKEVLDEIGPHGAIADAKVRVKLSEAAVNIAARVMKENPAFALKPDEKISDAVNRVFSNLDEIGDVTLEKAVRSQGLTPDEFAAALKVSQSEAGRLLQHLSSLKRMTERLKAIDPAFDKEMKKLYPDITVDGGEWVNTVKPFLRNTEQFTKAAVVSGIDTTMRNVMGGINNVTFGTASRLLEGTVHSLNKAGQTLMRGKPVDTVTGLGKDMGKAIQDSVRPLYYLFNKGLSKDLSEMIAANNPAIMARLMGKQEGQEVVNSTMNRVAEAINVVNSLQDGFFRRAAFAESVDRQLSKVGLDMYDVLAKNGTVPSDVISKAIDDALKFTMSYAPKETAGGNIKKVVNGVEVRAPKIDTTDVAVERTAGKVVNWFETSLGASIIVPFPRFMANALAWQYRHSPFGLLSTPGDIKVMRAARASGDEAGQIAATQAAVEHGSKALVGTAAFLAAINYRKENQDIPATSYRNDDGTYTDVSTMWPAPFFLAVADYVVKKHNGLEGDSKKMTELLLGMKVPAGSQGAIIDGFYEAFDSDDKWDEAVKAMANAVAGVLGRVTQPFVTKQLMDLSDSLNDNTLARDPKEVDDPESLTEPAINYLRNRTPFMKGDLEPATSRGGDETDTEDGEAKFRIRREGELINRIIGIRRVPDGNELQKTMTELGIESFKVFGKPTGDRRLDNKITEEVNKVLPDRIAALMTHDYSDTKFNDSGKTHWLLGKKESRTVQRNAIRDEIKRTVAETAERVISDVDNKARAKIEYRKLPADTRRLVRQMYADRNNGKELEEVDDYEAAAALAEEIVARTPKFNKGGFVSRR
jgi:hypothetical protein